MWEAMLQVRCEMGSTHPSSSSFSMVRRVRVWFHVRRGHGCPCSCVDCLFVICGLLLAVACCCCLLFVVFVVVSGVGGNGRERCGRDRTRARSSGACGGKEGS